MYTKLRRGDIIGAIFCTAMNHPAATTAPVTEAAPRALEPQYYTDPRYFEKERAGLMTTTWQFAGHESRAKEAGEYFVFNIGGENMFCARGDDDKLRAFYNVCQHRGHELLKGEGKTRRITCPYHSWTYDLDGKFRTAPNIQNARGFDRDSVRLREVKMESMHGFIFINMDDNAAPMEEWFPGVRDGLREYVPHIAELSPLEWVEIPEKCNWKISVENYSECYHCPTNHRSLMTGVIKPGTYDIQPHGYALHHTTECQNMEKMSYPVDLSANPRAGDYHSWFLWPMFSFQVYPGNVLNTYHWRATAHDKVTVWRGWYSRNGEEDKIARQLAKQDLQTTIAEDISLVESVQRGLNSRGYTPGQLILDKNGGGLNSEHSLTALHKWMRAALGDNGGKSGN